MLGTSLLVLTTASAIATQEASWNPYYAHLALKLAAAGKSHRFTLQYCLWDQVGAPGLPFSWCLTDTECAPRSMLAQRLSQCPASHISWGAA